MERNPVEAIRNNAIGTRVVATVAGQLGIDAFVLVSTDKAVMPATVMGASKALAECAIDAAQRRFPATRYMAVRFGNVLGSSGSVVPIFRRQIAAGGPVTVTDRADDALLHDDPGGRRARDPRRHRSAAAARSSCSTWASRCRSSSSRTKMIELSGLRARSRHRDRDDRTPARREARGGPVQPLRAPQPTEAEKILLARREPMDIERVEAIFDEISLLVLEADAVGLAEKVAQLTELRVQAPVVAESS